MEYVTFIIAVDVPKDLVEGEDDDLELEDKIETQISEKNGFYVVGVMPTTHVVG